MSYHGEGSNYMRNTMNKEKDAYDFSTEGSLQNESSKPSLASLVLSKNSGAKVSVTSSTAYTQSMQQSYNSTLKTSSKDDSSVPQTWQGRTVGRMALMVKVNKSQTKMRRLIGLLCKLCREI